MTSTASLQALKDIHLGPSIGAWPLAYGWYFLICGITLAIVLIGIAIRNFLKNRKPKREALKKLKMLEREYAKNPDPNKMAYQLTVLLKRLCFAYYPRHEIASLYGKDWQAFLGNEEWSKTLYRLSYEKHTNEDITAIFPKLQNWIKKANIKEKNV